MLTCSSASSYLTVNSLVISIARRLCSTQGERTVGTILAAKDSVKLLLAMRSGNLCANPDCACTLGSDNKDKSGDVVVGEAAHIRGEKPKAARYDPTMTDDERNHSDNLIYLCPTCHTLVDKQRDRFSVELLHEWKSSHEAKVYKAIQAGFADVSYKELEYVTKSFMETFPADYEPVGPVISPKDKIVKNNLSTRILVVIRSGLALSREITEFLKIVSQDDPSFPERLKAGFLQEYYRLKRLEFVGDELFEMMCRFAQQGLTDQTSRSAGLAVLCYLFESCDIFEK